MTPQEKAVACAKRRWPEMPPRALETAYGAWLDVKTPPQPSDDEALKYGVSAPPGETLPFWEFVPEWCEGVLMEDVRITPAGRTGVRVEAVSETGRALLKSTFGGSPKGIAVRLWMALHEEERT